MTPSSRRPRCTRQHPLLMGCLSSMQSLSFPFFLSHILHGMSRFKGYLLRTYCDGSPHHHHKTGISVPFYQWFQQGTVSQVALPVNGNTRTEPVPNYRVLCFRNTQLCVINLPSFCDSVAFNNAAQFYLGCRLLVTAYTCQATGDCSNSLAVARCYSPPASKSVTGQSAHHTKFYTWTPKASSFE